MTSRGVLQFSRWGALGVLGFLCPLPLGCTIQQVDNPDGTGATSGASAGASSAGTGGSAVGAGGSAMNNTGGATTTGGSAGSIPVGCGDITDRGVCQSGELVFCQGAQLKRVDCAKAGAQCQVKDGQADCVSLERAAASCGSLTTLGSCEDDVILYCDKEGLTEAAKEINCPAYGQACDPTGAKDGGALCVPHGACPSNLDENGVCDDSKSLRFCENGEQYIFNCGVDECRTVGGFADCFLPGVADGCGTETTAGRCDAATGARVACMGGVVAREDCPALGLRCQDDGAGNSVCAPGTCPASCPADWSCNTATFRCEPATTPTRDWTVMVYVVGDNNLADAAWIDLNEMEVPADSARVQTVAEFELSDTFSSLAPAARRTGVYRLPISHDDDPADVGSLSSADNLGNNINMAQPAQLSEFVRWAAETYPAKHQALILWDHGMGWRGGFVDTESQGQMTLRNIVDGIRDSGVHMDVLAFDACLMGMHEVALATRGLADTLVASEEVVPGGGFPYDAVLQRLINRPAMTGVELGEAIVQDYSASYSTGLRARSTTLSSLDLAQVSSVNQQLSDFAGQVSANLKGHRTEVQDALRAGTTLRFKDPDSADLMGMLTSFEQVEGDIGTSAKDFKTWFTGSKTVLANQTNGDTMAAATGLALYLPENAFSQYNTGTFEDYRSSTSFLPLQPWHALVGRLTQEQDSGEATPAPADAVDTFSVLLSWADTPDGTKSNVDLDLYVYEPNGDFATPSNGTVSGNGLLSADSYDTETPRESYDLQVNHQSGTYIVLVHYYGGPVGEQAYPRLQLFEKELPGGSRTLVRGKVVNRELVELPMDNATPLATTIDAQNVQKVLDLEYSNIWWAVTVQVK